MNWFTVIVLVSCLGLTLTQRKGSLSPTAKNYCIGQRSCGECIAVDKGCAWCKALNYDIENRERCNLLSEHGNCPKEDIVSPNSTQTVEQSTPNRDGTSTIPPIQIQPQVVKLNLRPNDPQRFNLTFRVANNYPLDLYYLMDMSYSMKNDKDKLSTLANNLATGIRALTDDFQLGFGSFVDKNVMPYISKHTDDSINQPCTDCVPTYGYKNHLPLDADINKFQQEVSRAAISYSIDSPEGGTDAFLQAIVCESQIGWRTPSRKMILYSTDAASHFAGDGKLGGILKPNDGLCHLDNNGMYTQTKTQDYPSLSQIATLVADKGINTIFAVTENQTQTYEMIRKFLIGAEVGRLDGDSANIVSLITQAYQKISSRVELMTSGADDVIVRYFSRCKDSSGPLMETNTCSNLNIGDSVTFEIEVEVKECPKDPAAYSRKFNIKPVGLPDSLEARIELYCKCDCESGQTEGNSTYCNSNGTLVCGSCSCEDKYYGKTCLCYTGDSTEAESQEKCKAPGTNTICSNNGECICGTCECKSRSGNSQEKYSGKFCQCDDYSCPFYNSALCGGSSHGKCQCGQCNCTSSYTGENCGCSTATDACVDSNNGLCGGPGRGQCECNKCKCLEGSDFQGPTCEDCKYCELVCQQNRDCVECVAFGTGKKKYDCFECKSRNYITTVATLPESSNSCEFKDENDCIFYFSYSYEGNELKIVAQQTLECPKKANVGAIVGGVIGGIVGIVVACLLAWRLFFYIKDKRELEAFLKEAAKGEWAREENPVFKPATKHYKNPTYKKESQKVTLDD